MGGYIRNVKLLALLAKIQNPKPGINAKLWGFYYWRTLHFVSLFDSTPYTTAEQEHFLDLLMCSLTCRLCRESFALFRSLVSLPVFLKHSPRFGLAMYLYTAHAYVQMKKTNLAVPLITFAESVKLYKQLPRSIVVSDFFTTLYFLLEHYPDVAPDTTFTRSTNREFATEWVSRFARAYYRDDVEKQRRMKIKITLPWSANSTALLAELYKHEQGLGQTKDTFTTIHHQTQMWAQAKVLEEELEEPTINYSN